MRLSERTKERLFVVGLAALMVLGALGGTALVRLPADHTPSPSPVTPVETLTTLTPTPSPTASPRTSTRASRAALRRPVPAARPRPSAGTGPSKAQWQALIRCESSGKRKAVSGNGLYHGLFQFDRQTWRGQGGKGLPSRAPAWEQGMRARTLYADRGAAPWPRCGRYLR